MVTAQTPGQADDEPPTIFARWCRVDTGPGTDDDQIASRWAMAFAEDRQFWTSLNAELDAAREPQPAPGAELSRARAAMLELLGLFRGVPGGWQSSRTSMSRLGRIARAAGVSDVWTDWANAPEQPAPDLAKLRDAIAALAADLDHGTAVDDTAAAGCSDHAARQLLEERASTSRGYATALRKLLEGQ